METSTVYERVCLHRMIPVWQWYVSKKIDYFPPYNADAKTKYFIFFRYYPPFMTNLGHIQD